MQSVILIVGPTASGKTKLGITIAQHFDTVILSADARQVYAEMRIGTARPSEEELNLVKHLLVGHKSIHESYNAALFEIEAINTLDKLAVEYPNKPVVIVGGSGLYIKALVYGLDEMPEVSSEIKQEVSKKLQNQSLSELANELKILDPTFAQVADLQNPRRLQRAFEVILSSGLPYSSFRKKKSLQRNFKPIWVGIDLPREELYSRINSRVDQMIELGLIEEVRSLQPYKHLQALQTVGYKELFDYFDGKVSLSQAIESIKTNTRRYAKRQMTWFKQQESDIHWVTYPFTQEVISYIQSRL